jgi:hypothetical protein
MSVIYFHCSSADGIVIDQRGSVMESPADVPDHAARTALVLMKTPGPEDWRNWTLHASDEHGEEIYTMPFSSLIGRPQ